MEERGRHRRAGFVHLRHVLPSSWQIRHVNRSRAQNLARLTTNQQGLNQWTNIAAGAVCDVRRRCRSKPRGSRAGDGSHWNGHGRSCRRSQLVYGISRAVERRPFRPLFGSGRLQSGGRREGQTKEDAFNAALAACGSEQDGRSSSPRRSRACTAKPVSVSRETNKDLLASRDASERDEQEHSGTRRSGDAREDRRNRDRHELAQHARARAQETVTGVVTRASRRSSRRLLTTSL